MAGVVFLTLIWLALLRLVAVSLLSVAAAVRRAEVEALCDLAAVTLIVPACDEAAVIGESLAKTRESVVLGATLIVVDDGSRDGTSEAARRALNGCACARVLVTPANEGKARALNRGLALVKTPYVMTLDADTWVSPEAVGRALCRLEAAKANGEAVDVVAFDVSVAPSCALLVELQGIEYDASLNFERRGQSLVRAVSVAPGAATLWRRAALCAIGGFSADTATEDVDATLRLAALGRATAHVAGATALTDPPRNLRHLLAQRRRWCLGHYQNIPRHLPHWGDAAASAWLAFPNFFFLSAFMPALLITGLGLLVFGSGNVQPVILASTLLWVPLVYAQRLIGLALAGRKSRVGAILLEPFTTLLLHAAAAFGVLGVWVAGLAGKPINAWRIRD